ncbi:MAG: hypothetical protein KKF46_03990 [Nanoarchaeota archaeon]|nr:hypothetical protein [Nanoarchaeota archaeon]MBU1321495.1 hypothetical protein [Nanoarchaeota archaeon]MBU1597379.1 hypothetical protein [Nanoarchaeota archaeon]MBU2441208.1 hypothetical protein [Nanoarchaeota archaeon]
MESDLDKIVYMSVEEGFLESSQDSYLTSKRIVRKISELVTLFLVHPADYDLNSMKIKNVYLFEGEKLKQEKNSHIPQGDMFIIYGDETSKNVGLDFGRSQYAFLKKLQEQGNFKHFFNTPQAEENTMKDALVEFSKNHILQIADTFRFNDYETTEDMLHKYGSLVLKPIFGCRGSGVHLIHRLDDLQKLDVGLDFIKGNYVLQEPLQGPEKRLVLLGGSLLCSRVHYNRKTPWNQDNKQETYVYTPSDRELELSQKIAEKAGLELAGIDFIGEKVNEINGTGSGLVIYNHHNELLYDKSDAFVQRVISNLK